MSIADSLADIRGLVRIDGEGTHLPLRLRVDAKGLSTLELLDEGGHLLRRWECPDRAELGQLVEAAMKLAAEFAASLPESESKSESAPSRYGPAVAALERIARRGGIPSIPDPVAWQREIREDRPLPGRPE